MATLATFTAVNPGVDGNRITINIIGVPGGPAFALVVTETDFNRFLIEISLGFDAGSHALTAGTWADVATLFQASAGADLVTMVGDAVATQIDGGTGFHNLLGGSEGAGEGQFFSADAAAPPCSTDNLVFFVPPGYYPARR